MNDDIIALNGITGECITTANDWGQRLKENPHDLFEEIKHLHENFLTELEGLAVQAIATKNWDAFYAHVVDFVSEYELHGEAGIVIGDQSDG